MFTYHLLKLRVIDSDADKLFLWKPESRPAYAASILSSDTDLERCQLEITSTNKAMPDTYYIVGNSYDHGTKFTPKKLDWFADGACEHLFADQFNAGDSISVSLRLNKQLYDWQLYQAATAVWVLLTGQGARGAYIDYHAVRQLVRQ